MKKLEHLLAQRKQWKLMTILMTKSVHKKVPNKQEMFNQSFFLKTISMKFDQCFTCRKNLAYITFLAVASITHILISIFPNHLKNSFFNFFFKHSNILWIIDSDFIMLTIQIFCHRLLVWAGAIKYIPIPTPIQINRNLFVPNILVHWEQMS